MSQLIAIKLGSSNTAIYKDGEGLVLFEPSLVAVQGKSGAKTVVAVGQKASRMQGRTEDSTVVCSPIFEGKIREPELACVMLKSFLSRVIPNFIIKPKVKALVCVPIGLSLKDKKDFEAVCHHAGIQDVEFVPSIVTGAIGYNLLINEPVGRCLVNIGGGSTDVASVSVNSIVAGVNIGIGGNNLDRAIEQAIKDVYKLKIGEGVATKLKEEIGTLYPNDSSDSEVSGIDIESGLAKSVVVDSRVVYEAIIVYFDKIVDAIKTVIISSPTNIIEDIQNEGVYIMGGTSLITGAEQYFRKRLSLPIHIQDNTTAIDVIGAGMLLKDAKLCKIITKL